MLKRSITGLILGVIMIFGLLYSVGTAAILFLLILLFSSWEWLQHFTKREGSFASAIFIFINLFIAYLIVKNFIAAELLQNIYIEDLPQDKLDINKANGILILILAIYGFALIAKKNWPFVHSWYSGIFYIGFPILIGFSFLNENFDQHKWIILGLIIINWSNDVFAYLTGKMFGKHLLAPDISPKKTVEGALGGLFAALIASWLINEFLFIDKFAYFTIIILGLAVWASGILGDLYESKMKRIVGIKDSGELLPGHGGFLDRFDSFFFVLPVGIFVLSF